MASAISYKFGSIASFQIAQNEKKTQAKCIFRRIDDEIEYIAQQKKLLIERVETPREEDTDEGPCVIVDGFPDYNFCGDFEAIYLFASIENFNGCIGCLAIKCTIIDQKTFSLSIRIYGSDLAKHRHRYGLDIPNDSVPLFKLENKILMDELEDLKFELQQPRRQKNERKTFKKNCPVIKKVSIEYILQKILNKVRPQKVDKRLLAYTLQLTKIYFDKFREQNNNKMSNYMAGT
jgi:hypothetical protein